MTTPDDQDLQLALHITRLERDDARTQARRLADDVAARTQNERALYYRLRELFEAARPGMEHGDLDDDYLAVIGSIRRLRALAVELEAQLPEAVEQ